jgi:hypothetical protein
LEGGAESAYLSNIGSLLVVVELSSSEASQFWEAEHGPRWLPPGRLRVRARDLSEGEKTLGYYVFEDAKSGGTLHIPYMDDDGTSQRDWKTQASNQVGPAVQGVSLKFIWTERKTR